MKYKYQYKDNTERQSVLDSHKGKYLVEEQNITDGNFLIFSDIKPTEDKFKDLQDNQLIVMNAIADLYSSLNTSNTTATS